MARKPETWRDVVRKIVASLQARGEEVTLPNILAGVSDRRKRGRPNWDAAVRRTTQELRDAGEIGFSESRKRRGRYAAAPRAIADLALDDFAEAMGAGYEVTEKRYSTRARAGGKAGALLAFTVGVSPENDGPDGEVIADAVATFERRFPGLRTGVAVRGADADGIPHTATLGPWMPSPAACAAQVVAALGVLEGGARKRGSDVGRAYLLDVTVTIITT